MISPSFTTGKLKMLFPLMKECAMQLQKYVEKRMRDGEIVEISDVASRFAIEIVGVCVFGVQCDAFKDEESEFVRFSKKIFGHSGSFPFKVVIKAACPFICKLFNIKLFPPEITDFMVKLMKDTMRYREENNVVRNDFIHLLMELKNNGKIGSNDNTDAEDMKHYYSQMDENGDHTKLGM